MRECLKNYSRGKVWTAHLFEIDLCQSATQDFFHGVDRAINTNCVKFRGACEAMYNDLLYTMERDVAPW